MSAREKCESSNARCAARAIAARRRLAVIPWQMALVSMLLRALPGSGLAIVNSDNPYCREHLHTLASAVKTFGVEEKFHPTFHILDIREAPAGITCDAVMEGKHITLKTRLIGAHVAMNLAPAYLVAMFLGMEDRVIQEKIKRLLTPKGTLEIYPYGSSVIIDDSYNANPDGFRSALHTLATFPSKRDRIVITRGMIELGEWSEDIHQRIGEEIAFVADELVIISPDAEHALRAGIQEKYHITVKTISDPVALREYVRTLKDANAVVLVENRVPDIVRQEWCTHPHSAA